MAGEHRHFLPAAGHDWLLPLYDPLQRLFGGDSTRRELIQGARLAPGQRVLDIGCGTGSLTVALARDLAEARVVGLDPDPKALARAARKAARAGVAIRFDEGFSDALPYRDASFDRVFSSFMLHHLKPGEKERTLLECRRVLAPGGLLLLLDFGGAEPRSDGLLARWLHRSEALHDHQEGGLSVLVGAAGFGDVSVFVARATLFGRVSGLRAVAPDAA